MTSLLLLYPPAWRRRYGRELAELIASQPASLGMAIDLVAGAIDAWINPQSSAAAQTAPDARGAGTMLAKMMPLRCAGYSPAVTPADTWKAVAVVLGGTAVLTLLWMGALVFTDSAYIESLSSVAFLVPVLASLHYTSLKGRSARVQVTFIGGLSAIVIGISLVAGWLNMPF